MSDNAWLMLALSPICLGMVVPATVHFLQAISFVWGA